MNPVFNCLLFKTLFVFQIRVGVGHASQVHPPQVVETESRARGTGVYIIEILEHGDSIIFPGEGEIWVFSGDKDSKMSSQNLKWP